MEFNQLYYFIKPIIPRSIQLHLRRNFIINSKRLKHADTWPIDEYARKSRDHFHGWPKNKKLAIILTHDVDTDRGQKNCPSLINIEERLGFRSSFNFVLERYNVDPTLRTHLVESGFEVGVHGLNHDGKLYKSHKIFQERAAKINGYLKTWKAVGFRSPAMHHNLEWIHDLDIEYDASTFDTDPFEPQPDGVGTIFPFWVSKDGTQKGYVELPYTLPQDFTLFVLMKENTIDIWKKKLDWIAENGGMALVNTHPDYMNFDGEERQKSEVTPVEHPGREPGSTGQGSHPATQTADKRSEGRGRRKMGLEEYPAEYYEAFLEYVKEKYEGQYWHVLPRKMARFWKEQIRSQNSEDRRQNGKKTC